MDRKHIRPALLTLALLFPALASAVELAPSAPDRYTVRRGDTLWEIAGKYLREPWRWPEIWQHNPQVRNPNLIYPGDVLTLDYVEGRPVVRVDRGRRGGTVKLSPEVREIPTERAIPTIPVDAIGPFVSESRVLTDDELARAPYILSAGREHVIGVPGDLIYARQLPEASVERYGVYRAGGEYRAPGSDEVLGYEATYIADAIVEQPGDPATLFVTRATREIQPGDRLLPLEEDLLREPFLPRAPDADVRGNIISVPDGVTQVGRYQVVVIDRGTQDGIESGHVLAVYSRPESVVDPNGEHFPVPEPRQDFPLSFDTDLTILRARIANAYAPAFLGPVEVQLPERRAGVVMVVRPFERVSYALVMEATRPMHLDDVVATP